MDRTYEELKLRRAKVMCTPAITRLDRTYEELKLRNLRQPRRKIFGLDRTYEELKLYEVVVTKA